MTHLQGNFALAQLWLPGHTQGATAGHIGHTQGATAGHTGGMAGYTYRGICPSPTSARAHTGARGRTQLEGNLP